MIKGSEGIFSPPRISPTFSAKSLPSEVNTPSFVSDRIRDTRSYPSCDGAHGTSDDKPTLLYGLPPSFRYEEPSLSSNKRPTRIPETFAGSSFSHINVSCNTPRNVPPDASDPSNLAPNTTPIKAKSSPLGEEKENSSCVVDECLAEIPLSTDSDPKLVNFEHTNLSAASPFLARTINYANDHSLQKRSPQHYLERDHTSPANVDAQDDDDDDVVSEFLRSHGDLQPLKNLPSVEDGLSSGSELDTPPIQPKDQVRMSKVGQHLPSCSPDSTRGLFLGSSQESRPWRHADTPSHGEPFVNPPLVQDILEMVHEIKQTLSDDKAALDKTVDSSFKASDDKSRCVANFNNLNAIPNKEDFRKYDDERVQKSKSDHTAEHCDTSQSGPTPSFRLPCDKSPSNDGICEKLTVCASIEQPVLATESNQSSAQTRSAQQPKPDKHPHDAMERFAAGRLEAHQWTFPAVRNTVYSSSDDEDNRIRFHRDAREKQRTLSEIATQSPASNSELNNSHARRATRRKPTAEGDEVQRGVQHHKSTAEPVTLNSTGTGGEDYESDEDTDQLLDKPYQSDKPVYIPELKREANLQAERKGHLREVSVRHPDFPDTLLHGVLFRASYLGSTQLLSQKQPTRNSRMFQAQEAVNQVKAPDGENQPSVAVALFVSTDRIMILNNNLQEILIDHELKSVSYIADIGEIFVLMARRPGAQRGTSSKEDPQPESDQTENKSVVNTDPMDSSPSNSTSDSSVERSSQSKKSQLLQKRRELSIKLICHVLESSEARSIAQAVGHAFQLAYLDFLRENGIEDLSSVKHLNYEEVLSQQEIFCDELTMFSDKDRHKEITIPKQRGEPLGVVIVSSGWGSLLPTALLANMNPVGPAARCGQLNIGNHIISVNSQSLVGLPLNTCQHIIKSCRNQTSVRLTVVDCPPVVEVLIRRPSLHYQLGFSVQDGVICSLLRGGIAERGGIRVDHRIIEINGQSVVAVSHERIVHLLANAVGEIHIRTMPTSVFRLLTGQDAPNYI